MPLKTDMRWDLGPLSFNLILVGLSALKRLRTRPVFDVETSSTLIHHGNATHAVLLITAFLASCVPPLMILAKSKVYASYRGWFVNPLFLITAAIVPYSRCEGERCWLTALLNVTAINGTYSRAMTDDWRVVVLRILYRGVLLYARGTFHHDFTAIGGLGVLLASYLTVGCALPLVLVVRSQAREARRKDKAARTPARTPHISMDGSTTQLPTGRHGDYAVYHGEDNVYRRRVVTVPSRPPLCAKVHGIHPCDFTAGELRALSRAIAASSPNVRPLITVVEGCVVIRFDGYACGEGGEAGEEEEGTTASSYEWSPELVRSFLPDHLARLVEHVDIQSPSSPEGPCFVMPSAPYDVLPTPPTLALRTAPESASPVPLTLYVEGLNGEGKHDFTTPDDWEPFFMSSLSTASEIRVLGYEWGVAAPLTPLTVSLSPSDIVQAAAHGPCALRVGLKRVRPPGGWDGADGSMSLPFVSHNMAFVPVLPRAVATELQALGDGELAMEVGTLLTITASDTHDDEGGGASEPEPEPDATDINAVVSSVRAFALQRGKALLASWVNTSLRQVTCGGEPEVDMARWTLTFSEPEIERAYTRHFATKHVVTSVVWPVIFLGAATAMASRSQSFITLLPVLGLSMAWVGYLLCKAVLKTDVAVRCHDQATTTLLFLIAGVSALVTRDFFPVLLSRPRSRQVLYAMMQLANVPVTLVSMRLPIALALPVVPLAFFVHSSTLFFMIKARVEAGDHNGATTSAAHMVVRVVAYVLGMWAIYALERRDRKRFLVASRGASATDLQKQKLKTI